MSVLRASSATDAGRVRATNQDLALVTDDLLVVADGMGGHAGGEIAAETAVEALRRAFGANRTVEGLTSAAERANRVVYERAEQQSELRGMGTTLTAAALVSTREGESIVVVNVGDSRAYLLENGRLARLTEDHSLVEEMVRSGELTEAQAATHPHRHILTRALGIDPGVDVDSWVLVPVPGMRLLLCSDGLTNECTEAEITAALVDNSDREAAVRALVDSALAHGGSDNITVIVADVEGVDPSAAGADETRKRVDGTKPVRTSHAPTKAVRTRPTTPAERRPRERLVTPRVALFVLALVGILGGTAGFVGWFDRASYFLGIHDGHVAVFEGRPGGLLFLQPSLVEVTPLTTSEVFAPDLPALRSGMLEPSHAAADEAVVNLESLARTFSLGSTSSANTSGNTGNS